jgi:hypothetical protein
MIFRRLAMRTPTPAPIGRNGKRRQNRIAHFALVTLISGASAFAIAVGIESIPTVVGVVLPPPTPPAVEASVLFPPVAPVHQVVDVYDPPPPAPPQAWNPAPAEPGDNSEPPESEQPGDN